MTGFTSCRALDFNYARLAATMPRPNPREIVGLAARFRLLAIYPSPNFAPTGAWCCYGFNQNEQFRQAASYVSRILSGAKVSELPVQTPTKFELSINLRTAKALDLVVSRSVLATADEVIE